MTNKNQTFNSQFQQDYILYHALFRDHPYGYYVDLAASYPRWISNTWFFDHCLNWEGLCVDADNSVWGPLERERSCKVVKTCIADKEAEMEFQGHGVLGGAIGVNKLGAYGGGESKESRVLRCAPLQNFLGERKQIDFLSLDV